MEARIIEGLASYSAKRRQFMASLVTRIPSTWVENNHAMHGTLLSVTLLLIIAVFSTTRRLTLFSLHPVCMAIGGVLCFGEGLLAFRNTFLLDTFSPIMQHDKTTKVRTIHQTVQTVGALFIALGLLFIFAHKLESGKSLWPHTLHSTFGVLCLALIVAQVVAGYTKLTHLQLARRRVFRWHGDLGLLLWDCLTLTICLGLLSFLPFGLFSLCVMVLPLLSWAWVVAQVQVKVSHRDEDSIEGVEVAEPLVAAENAPQEDVVYEDASRTDTV